jgi:hypothetical protein
MDRWLKGDAGEEMGVLGVVTASVHEIGRIVGRTPRIGSFRVSLISYLSCHLFFHLFDKEGQ